MKYQVFNLREEPINGFMPTLTAYIIDDNSCFEGGRKRPAIVVCPGGGYAFCSNREAEPIALQYMAAGYSAFVLDYTVAPTAGYPEPQKDAFNAIKLIREHADEWGIYKEKIAVIGFSAGGHVAASVATLWDEEPFKCYNGINKPNAAILSYPVISSDPAIAHMGSFDNLCGDDAELKKKLSLETRVTDKTPPCFIWHTFEDTCVPVENSLRFAEALKKAGGSCEMHIYPHGPHGLSLANSDTAMAEEHIYEDVQEWVRLSVRWLNELFDKNRVG
ncbi:MAG: alpha/beta hydrolase [Eubacteriales bacterium]|nr:alpha/beta hydrolase [Eubacteriales bacterium]